MSIAAANSAADSPGSGVGSITAAARPSRYECQKRRDWLTFGQYLRNHRPPLELSRCSGAHVLEFLRYLDQFGKTKVHSPSCPFFGHPSPPAPCPCPLKQAWGSLDALVGRLRAAFEEHGGAPEANPFGARAVRLYLRDVRDTQAKARGIAYEKKRRRRQPPPASKQAKQQHQQVDDQQHQHHPHCIHASAAAAVPGAVAAAERVAPELAPQHFFFPPAHHFFYGGHFFSPALATEAAAQPAGPAPAVGVTGEDVALAMSEAQDVGCNMMPLSVFH